MHEGTFPFWVIALILGAACAYFVGYAAPYVTKESKEEARKYVKGKMMERPKVIIKSHIDSEVILCLVVGLSIAAMIFFFCDGFPALIMKLGGGIFAVIFAILILLIGFMVTLGGMTFMYLFGATVSSGMLEKRYQDRYNAIVEMDLEEPYTKQ